jgi:peptide/nickel transport system substrate-binding protein
MAIGSGAAIAGESDSALIVAGPRTPESLDQEYPPTEAVHEARRNINEPLLRYASKKGEDGIIYEDFSKIEGDLAEAWEVSPDKKSITFHLRKGVKSSAGNELTADDVMWTFARGWNLKANFHWYTSQVLNIVSPEDAFKKIDEYTVQVNIPYSSPLIDRLWTNIGLGILDSQELKKHVTADDPWASKWLSANSASYAPYFVTSDHYVPGQQVVYEASPNFYRGEAQIKKVIFREMPTSAPSPPCKRARSMSRSSFSRVSWRCLRRLRV